MKEIGNDEDDGVKCRGCLFYWFVYVVWFICIMVILILVVFIVFYSFMWGVEIFNEWFVLVMVFFF